MGIPYEVIAALSIKEGDEVDFFKYSDMYFLFAKKSDIVKAITSLKVGDGTQARNYAKPPAEGAEITLDSAELSLLKKLDTVKYKDRTESNILGMLSDAEKRTLQSLISKKAVSLFKKDDVARYSITKSVYDKFLFGKRETGTAVKKVNADDKPAVKAPEKKWVSKLKEQNMYADLLEAKGYIVLSNEAEAAGLSSALEESIRMGLVVGTRAFNKKFYVALKGFVTQNAPMLLRIIEKKGVDIATIAKTASMEEDAARTILYLLAESGDVTEVRRDIFKAA
ncbi:SpoVT/AbrB domain protein [mine drainage metagenome]|uniref:SpoVT/AbrB domain protein n=1 Tax=mine drainage metagenome TaxID=410659 RepID=T1CBD1_9ZZZZ